MNEMSQSQVDNCDIVDIFARKFEALLHEKVLGSSDIYDWLGSIKIEDVVIEVLETIDRHDEWCFRVSIEIDGIKKVFDIDIEIFVSVSEGE